MVGEIRDFETAEIAIKAALTGHLVLSTLHTNDAPSSVSRLLNMGIEPFLVASSVNLIGAQRLVRKLCSDCKEAMEVPEQVLIDLGVAPDDCADFQVMRGAGCRTCNNTGYKGRIAVYEIMIMTDELSEFVLNGASTLELNREAIRQGMKTLRMSALSKLGEGMTSMEEIVRATAPD
jgi:type IV pilus assembly protein PilB